MSIHWFICGRLGNGEQLEMVDTALFALCLDANTPADTTSQIHRFLHGDAANR